MSFDIDPTLVPLFDPKGVMIVGASQNPTKLGFGLARNLVQSNFKGAVHFVSPRGGTLLERPVYPRISDVPDPVDLAVLLIPAAAVPEALAECGRRGIRMAIIASGGFREVGDEGAALESAALSVAREYQMRLVGPNCIGILDTHLPLDTTFLPPPGPTPGDVAFISHSGAICAAVIDWARGQGFGLSRLVSLGNQVDVTEADVLVPVAADPFTKVITMYLESVGDGRRFVAEARRVTQQKPVIALKVGRFASGRKAVESHTGALAGRESAFDAAFRRAGVIRAETSEEQFDWARALAWCPLPAGPRVAVLTNAGGPGVTAADALESHGLELAQLDVTTKEGLSQVLPPSAAVQNPVDMLASASPTDYAACLRLLLADPGVDSVIVLLPPPPMYAAGGVARTIIPLIYASNKPVLLAVMGERMVMEAVEHFRAARIPEYRFPERAASALAVLTQRAQTLDICQAQPVTRTDVQRETAARILASVEADLAKATAPSARSVPQAALLQIMQAYGIPVPTARLARTAEEAAKMSRQLGFPLALKIASPDILHKSDVGGILLNLQDEAQVTAGFERLLSEVSLRQPGARILGAHLQPMILEGQEVIVGAVQDPQFGPLLMFGSGGVEVEGLRDVEFALAPILQQEAEAMLTNTWAGRKLDGYRNIPAADRGAVLEVIIRLGLLAADFPQLAEIEINPLRVLPAGKGALALDVRAAIG